MGFFVYVLRRADRSYCTGHADDLDGRFAQHQAGTIDGDTKRRRPVVPVFSQPCAARREAREAGRRIKGRGRAKKEAMCRGDWAEVSRLARARGVRERP